MTPEARYVRYGKSSQGLLKHKSAMYDTNADLLARNDAIARAYRSQPPRLACKNCLAPLPSAPTFVSHEIGYSHCARCGHLNGAHEETGEFCNALYTQDDGKAYAQAYAAVDRDAYFARVQDIYQPKAEFLCAALAHVGVDHRHCRVADVGAGSGYFVAALQEQGFAGSQGFEVSANQVSLGNAMLPGSPLQRFEPAETRELLVGLDSQIVSMIGVLEHLQDPREALAAIAANPRVRYLYLSLPLYSPSVAIEAAFPGVFNRHLGGAHTHLYTEASIAHFSGEFGFESVAEWWFGLDLTDLYRSLWVTLAADPQTSSLAPYLAQTLGPGLDAMQQALDSQRQSSEVHLLLRKIT